MGKPDRNSDDNYPHHHMSHQTRIEVMLQVFAIQRPWDRRLYPLILGDPQPSTLVLVESGLLRPQVRSAEITPANNWVRATSILGSVPQRQQHESIFLYNCTWQISIGEGSRRF